MGEGVVDSVAVGRVEKVGQEVGITAASVGKSAKEMENGAALVGAAEKGKHGGDVMVSEVAKEKEKEDKDIVVSKTGEEKEGEDVVVSEPGAGKGKKREDRVAVETSEEQGKQGEEKVVSNAAGERGKKDEDEKVSVTGGVKANEGEDASLPSAGLFKKKPKGSLKRLRSRASPSEETGEKKSAAAENGEGTDAKQEDGDADLTAIRENLSVLVQAQKLRQRQRRWHVSVGSTSAVGSSGAADEDEEAIAAGLRTNFAAEREDEVLEQQCEQFIEQEMRSKGYRVEERANEVKVVNPEDELYQVPESLRMQERPAYDPGEGLPAAGLEEVDLDETVRKQNEEQTLEATKHLRKQKARATDHLVAEQFRKRFRR